MEHRCPFDETEHRGRRVIPDHECLRRRKTGIMASVLTPYPGPDQRPRLRHRSRSDLQGESSMNVALWIITGILAVAFLGGGVLKVITPKEKLAAMANQGWAEDFGPGTIKAIGSLEILGAIGLTLPAMLDIAP